MIERDLVNYLLSIPAINTAVKGNIFYSRAKSDVSMPWIVIQNTGGSRRSLTVQKTEPRDTISIYVEGKEQFKTRDIANLVEKALDRYRGDMGDSKDLFITTATIRDLDGWQGSFRYFMTAYVQYIIPTNVPR